MAQAEIVDRLAGFAMFADLTTPQLERVAHTLEEAWYPEGERILRQGLTGSDFFVIIEGDCEVRVDGELRATLGPGRVLRPKRTRGSESSSSAGRTPASSWRRGCSRGLVRSSSPRRARPSFR
ncbi:MAG TPA: hypothetical protein VNF73_06260 [Candidatus Saccharimonadales bacterium]|nr:hypothetical protein [Candidatus Saccharimonadales bacterium]